MTTRTRHRLGAGQGPRVARTERQHALVGLLGDVLAPGNKVRIRGGQQLENSFFTLLDKPGAQREIPRIHAHRLVHAIQAALHVALTQQRTPVTRHALCGTADKRQQHRSHKQCCGACKYAFGFHGPAPNGRLCRSRSGR